MSLANDIGALLGGLRPGRTFRQEVMAGLIAPAEDPKYIAWLHTRRCVVSGERGARVTAHHLVGHGVKPIGGKVSDYLAFPLRFDLHVEGPTALHRIGHKAWEREYGSQLEHVAWTLLEAIHDGVLQR